MQPSVLSARAKMWPLTHWNDGPSRRPLPVRAAFMQRTRTDRILSGLTAIAVLALLV